MAFKGINVRQSAGAGADRIVFRFSLKDSAGADVTTGTTTIKLYELQSDGTLKSYDFNDNTFKTTTLTTETLALTHRTGNNGATNTGLWTAALTTLTGLTVGNIYLLKVNNSGASPINQERQFQYGAGEGDTAITAAGKIPATLAAADVTGNLPANLIAIDGLTTAGNLATLNLKKLNIVNSTGDALVCQSTGSNGRGAFFQGQGNGAGLWAIGGTNGSGVVSLGQGSGYGADVEGGFGTGAYGIYLSGNDPTKPVVFIDNFGTTGPGIAVSNSAGAPVLDPVLATALASTVLGTPGNKLATAAAGGVALAPTGLDAIAVTDPGGVASQTTLPKMLVALWRRAFKKTTLTATQLKTYADDGTTVNTTQATSDDSTTQTLGAST